MAEKTVDEYVKSLDGWKRQVAESLRRIVHQAAPEAEEAIKWAQPVFSYGGPFAYFKALKESINFGFWRGADLDDPRGLLEGTGDKMRHVKIRSLDDLQEDALAGFVRQAVAMNRSEGDPTRST